MGAPSALQTALLSALGGAGQGFSQGYSNELQRESQLQQKQMIQDALLARTNAQVDERNTKDTLTPEQESQLWFYRTGKKPPAGMFDQPMPVSAFSDLMGNITKEDLAKGKPGRGSAFKPNALDQRIYEAAPAYADSMKNYFDLYNQYRKNPTPTNLNALGSKYLVDKLPVLGQYVMGDPNDPKETPQQRQMRADQVTQMQQQDIGKQMQFMHALEFATQSTGTGRPPTNPQLIEDIVHNSPSLYDQPANFAMKAHVQNNIIAGRIKGMADMADAQGDTGFRDKARQRYNDLYTSMGGVDGITYDPISHRPQIEGFGTGKPAAPAAPATSSAPASLNDKFSVGGIPSAITPPPPAAVGATPDYSHMWNQ